MRPIRLVTMVSWVMFLALGFACEVARADTKIFTANATIDCSDFTWDGWDIVVRGCTVTINGAHSFHSLTVERDPNNPTTKAGKLTHDVFATCIYGSDMAYGLDLTIATNVVIQGTSGSSIESSMDFTGKGYIHGAGPGQGCDGVYAGGAGYGGAGADGYGGTCGGNTYGSPTFPASCQQPIDFGSGGGDDTVYDGQGQGGYGGGRLRLTVNGILSVNGKLIANGGNGTEEAGGGSGGSLWIAAGTVTGIGLITSNGGVGGSYAGGGGGGRIALYAANLGLDIGQLNARGGGTDSAYRGGAGTIYVESPIGSQGTLIVDNGSICGETTEFTGTQVFDMDLLVSGCGIVGPQPGDAGLHLTFNGDANVASGGSISANARGHGHSSGPGEGCDGTYAGGAAYGGAGADGYGSTCGGVTFGSPTLSGSCRQPVDLGSGGGDDTAYDGQGQGGAGGGVLRLAVTGVLTVDGTVSANGKAGTEEAGGGSGGSVWIEAGSVAGAGSITANGGAGGSYAGGGGGGRIALYAASLALSTGQLNAHGGGTDSAYRGGAGTVYVESPVGSRGALIVENGSISGETTEFSGVQVLDMDLVVSGCGIVGPQPGDAGLHLIVNGDVLVFNSGKISADARGYGHSDGPGQGSDCEYAGGAGHGGAGGAGYGCAGNGSYGSQTAPVDLGSGGGDDTAADGQGKGGAGGGVVRLTANGRVTVNSPGVISANGGAGTEEAAGGSGGSIWVDAEALVGSGLVTANGGNGGNYAGGGGGGRIAVFTCELGMNSTYITANGGNGWQKGQSGTVFFGSSHAEITQHPYDRLAFVGGAVAFSVTASGSGPLQYQWRHNGQNLGNQNHVSGANDSLLVISQLVVADAGAYDVVVTDACGSLISQIAVLIVSPPGDLNCDGVVSFADINPFVLALRGQADYEAPYPYCRWLNADTNGDRVVSFADIGPFVELLSGR